MTHITDNYIDEYITKAMYEKDKLEQENHKSSGKLSASMLGQPLQWQILKIMGVPQKEMDTYTLRKFQRGKDVEKWFVSMIPDLLGTQKFLEYRNCVGYCDAIVDTSHHHFDAGVIPHEVKSVANAKFKRICDDGDADRSHKLQACLYAMAMEKKHFAIDYIASDDYRIKTFVYSTEDYRKDVDEIIDRFDAQIATGLVPAFIPEEAWQSNPKYNNYPDFLDLSQDLCQELLLKIRKEKYESKENANL